VVVVVVVVVVVAIAIAIAVVVVVDLDEIASQLWKLIVVYLSKGNQNCLPL